MRISLFLFFLSLFILSSCDELMELSESSDNYDDSYTMDYILPLPKCESEDELNGPCVVGDDGPCGGMDYCNGPGVFEFNESYEYIYVNIINRDNLNELDIIEQDMVESPQIEVVSTSRSEIVEDDLSLCLKDPSSKNQILYKRLKKLKPQYEIECLQVISVSQCPVK